MVLVGGDPVRSACAVAGCCVMLSGGGLRCGVVVLGGVRLCVAGWLRSYGRCAVAVTVVGLLVRRVDRVWQRGMCCCGACGFLSGGRASRGRRVCVRGVVVSLLSVVV